MTTLNVERAADSPLPLQRALPKPRLQRPGFWRELLNSAFFIIAALVFSELALPRSSIDGPSMQPTLWAGNHLLISRISYLLTDPQYGQIAVFESPQPPHEMLIKRVIGKPGDTIEIRNGTTDADGNPLEEAQVLRNGEVLDEPYFINRPCRNCRDKTFVLGEDEYFMMGDNRNHSNDSRAFGPIRREKIVGLAIFRYLPLTEFGTLH